MSGNTETSDPYFKSSIAPIFVIGTSVFSIFWGTVAGLLVKSTDMREENIEQKVLACMKEHGTYKTPEDFVPKGGETPEELEDLKTAQAEYKDEKMIREQLLECERLITTGAKAFLNKEYLYLGIFSTFFAIVLGATVDQLEMSVQEAPTNFPFTATAFLVGSTTSIVAGYIGMLIAVYSNVRVTFMCTQDTHKGFITAFRGGQVLGFMLVGLALLILSVIIIIFKSAWYDAELEKILADGSLTNVRADGAHSSAQEDAVMNLTRRLMECVAGYGLGGSSVALFGRVGGGIYTKAADVGADLVGKTLKGLKEDDLSNPGTIADNVGDNVGDIAGMGSDLFGSLAESTCAALVVSSTSVQLVTHKDALWFPLCVTASGIIASCVSVLAAHLRTVTVENVQSVLKTQIGLSTVLMTVAVIPSIFILPETFDFVQGNDGDVLTVHRWTAYGCIMFGLWSGMIIGFITEYYTNNAYAPTKHLAESCEKGPAPNIILGLALGYLSCVIPILCITATIGYAFAFAGMYGIGLSALGMLGSLPVALSVDGYGPISDNAGGIAEMSGLPAEVRDQTDALDAAGNTTAAVGKGFAIGSACLVGLALFGAFITRIGDKEVDILQPTQFAGLLVGAMLPYAFSALTMKAVGDAAYKMMDFIIQDYEAGEELIRKNPDAKYVPDYQECIRISTEASLQRMIAPGALVLGSPLAAGFVFGPTAVAGLLAGAIVSGVQVAISASNTGGAWDNAKKEVEKMKSEQRKKLEKDPDQKEKNMDRIKARLAELKANNTDENDPELLRLSGWAKEDTRLKEMHVAAVVGDTVGDPLKDTSGPAINILIKLSAITSLVFGTYIANYHLFNPGKRGNRAAATQ